MAVRSSSRKSPAAKSCKLCFSAPPIKNSHLHPKFGYRRYVTNRGGSFVDLSAQREHNRQLTRGWFCPNCEGKFAETYAARLLSRLSCQRSDVAYSVGLLRFATSLSWRACLYELDAGAPKPGNREILRPALKKWRNYLLGKSSNVGQFTQHAFVFGESDFPWEERIGFQIGYIHNLVISQVGPLVCFGLLKKSSLNQREVQVLSQSEITDAGGVLPVISETEVNKLLTDDMVQVLNHTNIWCFAQTRKFGIGRRER